MTVAVDAGICSTAATVTTYYADHPDPTIHNREASIIRQKLNVRVLVNS